MRTTIRGMHVQNLRGGDSPAFQSAKNDAHMQHHLRMITDVLLRNFLTNYVLPPQ